MVRFHVISPGIYAEGFIVFVFLFVHSYVRLFVHSFIFSFVIHSIWIGEFILKCLDKVCLSEYISPTT